MTWLSRLLPQSPRLPRLADHNHRTRQGQRRRRMATLETLEGRTLLSNVTVSFPTPSSPLTITGDTFNDNFTITENPSGTVTVAPGATRVVPGVGVVTPSTIDGSSATVHHRQRGHVDHCHSPGHHQLRLRHPDRTGQDHSDDRQERHRHGDRGQSDLRRD